MKYDKKVLSVNINRTKYYVTNVLISKDDNLGLLVTKSKSKCLSATYDAELVYSNISNKVSCSILDNFKIVSNIVVDSTEINMEILTVTPVLSSNHY